MTDWRTVRRGRSDTRRESDTARALTVIAPGRALLASRRNPAAKSISRPTDRPSRRRKPTLRAATAAAIAIYQLRPFIRKRSAGQRERAAVNRRHTCVLKLQLSQTVCKMPV